jgi:hypothetical protein
MTAPRNAISGSRPIWQDVGRYFDLLSLAV